MARNEEKQLGRLNRLWLQKEREDGRIKDAFEKRPKLASLSSARAITKWLPSIKKEIEYCLQQSQLSHYPERKIEEFHQHIDDLEREYKRFLKKLRSLDPTCKHTPWEPRAYAKRRREPLSHTSAEKKPCLSGPRDPSREEVKVQDEGVTPSPNVCRASEPVDQDQPLRFDQSRLAVAVASSRTPSLAQQPDTGALTRVLLTGLPNLHSLALPRPAHKPHLLALACYSSSSDEEPG